MLLISVTNYLTQGYYGMSLCLREEWLPTLGVGNSKGLMDLVEAFKDTYKRTFQWRITKYGWDDNVQWHSMYSWFANDLGFWGTISVMFILGILLSTLYKDYLEANNPYAMVLICYFAIMIFFIPCNNQIFQSTYMMFSFVFMLIIWGMTRRHYWKIQK